MKEINKKKEKKIMLAARIPERLADEIKAAKLKFNFRIEDFVRESLMLGIKELKKELKND